jgi:hypothetical protein
VVGGDVLAVDGVEKPGRLVTELELRPDVSHARDILELESCVPRELAQACEETDGHAHATDLA